MAPLIRPLLLTTLAVKFSMCPLPPMMVRYFSFDKDRTEALKETRDILKSLDYTIDIYAPESHFLVTGTTHLRRDIRRYEYALAIYVTDQIQVHIIAEKLVYKRGSEASFGGGKDLIERQPSDRLPYEVQQKIYWPIIQALKKQGFPEDQERFKETWAEASNSKISVWKHEPYTPNSTSIFHSKHRLKQ